MTTVVGVRFREVGKIYYFDPGELELRAGDSVIVDTVRGTEFGTVMIGNRKVEDEEIVQPLRVVRRKATEEDVERLKSNRQKEKNAFAVCKEKVRERGLDMKLISAEYTFDNAKVLFYFTADGRVDFRELVKDLAAVFRIRIELRQVGVRDETKLMGGLGGCGRPLCCASYLSDFVPVSIRMAKEQNLSLNPQKISGVCGRLMCCLKNEADTYEDLNTRLPKDGGKVITPDGREGIAETVNVLRERVRVLFTDEQGNREMEEFAASELQFTPRRKPRPCECKAAKSGEESYDYDAAELVAEADSETDPDLKALARAEAEDVLEERDTDEADVNMAGARKRRRRRRKKKPGDGGSAVSVEAGGDSTGYADRVTGGSTGAAGESAAGSPEVRSVSGTEGAQGEQPRRRRRRGHSRNISGENGAECSSEGRDGTNRGNGTGGGRRSGGSNRDTGAGSGDSGSGNSGGGNSGSSNSGSGNDHKRKDSVKPEQPQGGEGREKKRNGTYRRFRKRRPENNPES